MSDCTSDRTKEGIDFVTGEIIDSKDFAERLPAPAEEQAVSLVGLVGC